MIPISETYVKYLTLGMHPIPFNSIIYCYVYSFLNMANELDIWSHATKCYFSMHKFTVPNFKNVHNITSMETTI